MGTFFSERLRFASRLGLGHFIISLCLASLVALLIFGLWFPYPYRELAGGRELFWLIISVDVVCGPLLTLVLAAPHKRRRELCTDIGLVAFIQLLALGYGLTVLAAARPVALAFEVDRFRVVSAADIDPADLEQAPENFRSLSLTGPLLVGIRTAKNPDEQFSSMSLGLAGIEPSMRPNWWTNYSEARTEVLRKAQPVAQLRTKHPGKATLIDGSVADTKVSESELLWLPLVSRKTNEWVVLIDKKEGLPRGYLPLDGF